MRCGCARTGSASNTTLCGYLPLGEVMGAILPKPPSGRLSDEAFSHQILIKPFQEYLGRPYNIGYLGRGYNASRKTATWRRLNVATGDAHAPADAEHP